MNKFRVAGIQLKFDTTPDLFSPKGIDMGTELLLSCIGKFSYSTALDWGCGWGAIAMWLAKNNPNSKITAIDSDIAAIRQATENCKNNDINNAMVMPSHGYSDVPVGYKFDLVASNPPTHRGREVVDSMIAQSLDRLNDGGVIILVIEARIKPWVARQLKEVFGDYKIVKRSPKHVVVMAQK